MQILMEQLINYIEQIATLNDEARHALHELATFEYYPKRAYILEEGQHCNKIWFVKSGMVRKYYLHNGKEKTVWINTENEIFTSLESYSQRSLSGEFLQAEEDTETISISRKNSEKLIRYPAFVVFTNTLMEREFVNIDRHTKTLSNSDARGKYEYLKQIAPEIIKRAKLGHIASLLGISQETLSRIRK